MEDYDNDYGGMDFDYTEHKSSVGKPDGCIMWGLRIWYILLLIAFLKSCFGG